MYTTHNNNLVGEELAVGHVSNPASENVLDILPLDVQRKVGHIDPVGVRDLGFIDPGLGTGDYPPVLIPNCIFGYLEQKFQIKTFYFRRRRQEHDIECRSLPPPPPPPVVISQ